MASKQYSIKDNNFALVNRATGEIVEGVEGDARIIKTSGRRYTQHMTDFDAYKQNLTARRLKSAVCMADYIAGAADRNNVVELSARGISKTLGLTRQTIGKSIRIFLMDDYLRRVPNADGVNRYMVSPAYILRVGAEDVWRITKNWDELPRTLVAADIKTLAGEYDRLDTLISHLVAERDRIGTALQQLQGTKNGLLQTGSAAEVLKSDDSDKTPCIDDNNTTREKTQAVYHEEGGET